jgi:predicted nuclease of predicted toxin-antitoxin system
MDENLPAELAELFREAGHDAVTVLDQELGGADDPEVASVCARERRAIVTLDTDFSDIRTYPPRMYSGIVVLRLNDQARDHVLQVGRKLLGALPSEINGRLFIVEESRIRIRD